VVGPKGRHDPKRSAVRHGHEDGQVTLGGRRVPVKRPRARSTDGTEEVDSPLRPLRRPRPAHPGSARADTRRRFERTREPIGEEVEAVSTSTSRSAVSCTFVARTRENLEELMGRRLDDVRLAALMLDGLEIKGRTTSSPWGSPPRA
jgi:putative transposase